MEDVATLNGGEIVSEDVKNYVDIILSDIISYSQGSKAPRQLPEFHLTRPDPTVTTFFTPSRLIIENEDEEIVEEDYSVIATDYTDAWCSDLAQLDKFGLLFIMMNRK